MTKFWWRKSRPSHISWQIQRICGSVNGFSSSCMIPSTAPPPQNSMYICNEDSNIAMPHALHIGRQQQQCHCKILCIAAIKICQSILPSIHIQNIKQTVAVIYILSVDPVKMASIRWNFDWQQNKHVKSGTNARLLFCYKYNMLPTVTTSCPVLWLSTLVIHRLSSI